MSCRLPQVGELYEQAIGGEVSPALLRVAWRTSTAVGGPGPGGDGGPMYWEIELRTFLDRQEAGLLWRYSEHPCEFLYRRLGPGQGLCTQRGIFLVSDSELGGGPYWGCAPCLEKLREDNARLLNLPDRFQILREAAA